MFCVKFFKYERIWTKPTPQETSYPTNGIYVPLFPPFLFHEKDPWDQQQKVISHKAFDVGNTLGP